MRWRSEAWLLTYSGTPDQLLPYRELSFPEFRMFDLAS